MKKTASIISWLFLPLIAPIYGLLIALYIPIKPSSFIPINDLYFYSSSAKLLFILLFLVFVVLAPSISILVLKKNQSIQSIQLEKREDRFTPLIIMAFYCLLLFGFLFYQSRKLPIPPLLEGMAFGGGIASIITYYLNKKRKFSLHSIGMGTLLGFFIMYSRALYPAPFFFLFGIILLGGLVGGARIYLNKNSLYEVGIGYLIGISSQIVAIFLVQILEYLIYINNL